MKINHPNEWIPRVGPDMEKGKAGRLEKGKDFASVLKSAAEDQQAEPAPVISPGGAVRQVAPGLALNQMPEYEKTASLLLDSLEKYQKVLGDPKASLKQVQPVVDQMRATVDRTENWVATMQGDHALKGVIEEALMQINKEIVRFDRGEYIG